MYKRKMKDPKHGNTEKNFLSPCRSVCWQFSEDQIVINFLSEISQYERTEFT